MIEIRLICYILIKQARLFFEFAKRHRLVIAKHTEHLGQAAYTASFLYNRERFRLKCVEFCCNWVCISLAYQTIKTITIN